MLCLCTEVCLYRCLHLIWAHIDDTLVILHLLDYTASLSISFPDSNVTATEGEKKSITCTVSGKTLPEQVTWQIKAKGEEEFKDVAGENYDAMPFGDVEGQPEKRVFNLTITKLTLEMSGDKYRCVPPEGTDFTFAKKSTEIEIVVTAKGETYATLLYVCSYYADVILLSDDISILL